MARLLVKSEFMVATRFSAYIVVEIPEPVRSQVQTLRDTLNTRTAKLPVEITIAGSSGVGPIPVGTSIDQIKSEMDKMVVKFTPFTCSFSRICMFPNTSIFYLSPLDSSPLVYLHDEVCSSGIPFSDIAWPYTPHCTLRMGNELALSQKEEIFSKRFPKETFSIDTISVYELDEKNWQCSLIYQGRLLGR